MVCERHNVLTCSPPNLTIYNLTMQLLFLKITSLILGTGGTVSRPFQVHTGRSCCLPKPAPPFPGGRCPLSSWLRALFPSQGLECPSRDAHVPACLSHGGYTAEGRGAALSHWPARTLGVWPQEGRRSFAGRSGQGSDSGSEGLLTEFLHTLFLPVPHSQESSGTFIQPQVS